MTSGTSQRHRAWFGLLVAVAAISPAAPRAADTRPDPGSPLATDGRRFYAVAADRTTLLFADLEKGTWNQLTAIGRGEIRGLTWVDDRLYFTDVSDASIQFVPTVGGMRPPEVLHRGAPLVRPTELTFAGKLVVADSRAGLFGLALAGGDRTPDPEPIPLPDAPPITEHTSITGWGYGEMVIADRESGLLAQLSGVGLGPVKYRPLQQMGNTGTPVQWNQKPERPETLRRRGYPGIAAPGGIAIYEGILYVADLSSNGVFACGIHDARAIRLPADDTVTTRLVATREWLIGLDARSGRLTRSRRLVPSELTLLPGARPQSLLPVLEYLYRHKLLTTRTVEVSGTIEGTLARARMTWPARGPEAEPYDAKKHFGSFCLLNPQFCDNGLPREQPPGTPVRLAELYAERYTTATKVTLDGSKTLGEIVDQAIESDQFGQRRSEAFLRQMNGLKADDPRVLREAREGVYRISQEQVRYVIPIEAAELYASGSDFRRLVETVQATIRIAPLVRVLTSKAGLVPAPDHPDDPNCAGARAALTELLAAIDYAAGASTRTVFVGVAEDTFDAGHRDFTSPGGNDSVLFEAGDGPGLTPTPPPAGDPAAPGVEPVTWREYRDDDHGTAIAAIIAGRTRPYQQGSGLTDALVAMFTHTSDATALAGDIERVLDGPLMTVINLSLKAKAESSKLRTVMENSQTMALFVVAAPNSASQVTLCAGAEVWYPACHGQTLDNVLVVGGTTLKGDKIFTASPVGKDVHLFAPAADYYSAGRDNSYVKVQGTSFATALVSAAAAMLSAMDPAMTPAHIKQRLVATATVMEIPDRPQWARRLDVRRALSHLNHAVIVDSTRQEHPAAVDNKEDTLTFKTVRGNKTLTFSVGALRRLTRVKGNAQVFDLAYVVPHQDDRRADILQLHTVKPARGAELNVCYLPLDAAGLVEGARTCVDLAGTLDYVAPVR